MLPGGETVGHARDVVRHDSHGIRLVQLLGGHCRGAGGKTRLHILGGRAIRRKQLAHHLFGQHHGLHHLGVAVQLTHQKRFELQ